jgi:hypothetical protein
MRRSQRLAAGGDTHAEARLLRDRLRARTIDPENVRLAACLGHVPAQLAIDWAPPEPPFGDPDCVVITLSQDNEWGHRMAALWAYALVKGTEWIWTEVGGSGYPTRSKVPDNAMARLRTLVQEGSPCPDAEEHMRQLERSEWGGSLGDARYELDVAAFDAQNDEDPRNYLDAEAAGQWTNALADALTIWGPNMHQHTRAVLWGNRHTIGQLWQVGSAGSHQTAGVPLYARTAREAYRLVVWAVDYYRGGTSRAGPVMDKAQLDVDSWTRKIMLPEVLA